MKKHLKLLMFLAFTTGLISVISCSSDPEGDSCGKVDVLSYGASSTRIDISIGNGDNANSTKIEYGPAGFTPGTGTSFVTSDGYVVIDDLYPSTTYDVYLTGICSTEEISKVTPIKSITTSQRMCDGTPTVEFSQFYSPTTMELYLGYNDSSPSYYVVEYGLAGFTVGNGTKLQTSTSSNYLNIENLQPNTAYDFYVKAVCYDSAPNDASDNIKFTRTTIGACPKPTNLSYYTISGSCNNGTAKRSLSWSDTYNAPSYTVCIVEEGGQPSMNGTTFNTSSNGITLMNMYCNWDAFYVRANCDGGDTSAWAGPYYF
jgi:hypothetical protein